MDCKCNAITLYTAQSEIVYQKILTDGICYSKEAYIQQKYEESAPIFLTAYRWFASEAEKLVPKPEQAQLPYWAFRDLYSVERSGEVRLLTLSVPLSQGIFFDLYQWNQILQLKFLDTDPKAQKAFLQELSMRGLKESQIMLSSFYPDLKAQILDSWKTLFRYQHAIQSGDFSKPQAIQAALWCIKKEWIISAE